MDESGISRRNPALKMLESIKENWYYLISTFLDIFSEILILLSLIFAPSVSSPSYTITILSLSVVQTIITFWILWGGFHRIIEFKGAVLFFMGYLMVQYTNIILKIFEQPMVENNDTTVMLKLQLSGWIIKIFSTCLFTLAFGIRPTSSFHRCFIPPYYLDQYPRILLANNSLSTMDVLPSPSPFPSRLRAISLNSKSSYRKSSRAADDMESHIAETLREHGTPLKVPMPDTVSWVSNGVTATDDGSGIYGLGASGGSVQESSERERRASQADGRRRNGRSNSQHSIFISVDELRMFGIEWIEMQNPVVDAEQDAD